MPLPGAGGATLLQMLGMLEPYDLASMGPASFWSVHFLGEAGRLAHADRNVYMADPDFVAPPAGLLDPGYLHERAQLIRADASLEIWTDGRISPDDALTQASALRFREIRPSQKAHAKWRGARTSRSSCRRRRTSRSSTATAMRWR